MFTETDADPQVTQVGMEFKGGPESNDWISEGLGFVPMRFPSGECYHTAGDYLMERQPDYCGDAALCLEILEHRGIFPMILPTTKPKGSKAKFEPGFVALFETAGVLHMTVPQPTEALAAACALWFVLGVEISHD